VKTFIKQISSASCHFLHVRSKYFPHHVIVDYPPAVIVRQYGRPSFTPISKKSVIVFSSSKGNPNNMYKIVIY